MRFGPVGKSKTKFEVGRDGSTIARVEIRRNDVYLEAVRPLELDEVRSITHFMREKLATREKASARRTRRWLESLYALADPREDQAGRKTKSKRRTTA